MIATESVLRPKPCLRGWSHAMACGVAVVSTIALCVRGGDNIATLLSLWVYGASTILLYAASAAYHLGSWHGRRRAALRSLDPASIFIPIAGNFTPFCVTLLSGSERVTVLTYIRAMAVIGVGASILIPSLPRTISVGLYLGTGWMGLIPAPTLIGLLPASALALLLGGGLLYASPRPSTHVGVRIRYPAPSDFTSCSISSSSPETPHS